MKGEGEGDRGRMGEGEGDRGRKGEGAGAGRGTEGQDRAQCLVNESNIGGQAVKRS